MAGDKKDQELLEVAEKGDVERAKKLIVAGANVNAADEDGVTPLFAAARYGRVQLVEELLKAHADVNKSSDSKTPLGVAITYSADSKDYRDIAKILIAAHADVNIPDAFGLTPLAVVSMVAESPEQIEIIKDLIKAHADVNKKSDALDNYTPLHWAAEHGKSEAAKLLIAAGADITAKDERGRTALFIAKKRADHYHDKHDEKAAQKYDEMVELLSTKIPGTEKTAALTPSTNDSPSTLEKLWKGITDSGAVNWLAPLGAGAAALGLSAMGGNGVGLAQVVIGLVAAGAALLGVQAYNHTGMFASKALPRTASADDKKNPPTLAMVPQASKSPEALKKATEKFHDKDHTPADRATAEAAHSRLNTPVIKPKKSADRIGPSATV